VNILDIKRPGRYRIQSKNRPSLAEPWRLYILATLSRLWLSARRSSLLTALGQECRLRVFRLLVQHGATGMAAGDIATKLGVAPNTLSAHLTVLSRAGLIGSRKEGRSVIYAIDLEGTRELLAYLVEDFCRAERKLCRPLIASALAHCC
jgi:ArsR family transcriptional regulator, arsenate/arsenite/antimonite-responsive transcriptional repressor